MSAHRFLCRRGGAMLQVLTCLAAMSVGVWLGAKFLGVEVNDLAYTALDESQLLEQVPDDWRPHKPGCPTGDCPESNPQERAEQLRQELHQLRNEATTLRQAATGNPAALEAVRTTAPLDSDQQQRDRTIAYWKRLREVAAGVAGLHNVAAISNSDTTGHVLDLRRRSFEYGQRAVSAIPYEGVDEQAVACGLQLAQWYENGAKLYGRASVVWEERSSSDSTGTDEAALSRARLQHDKEARLIREKAARVRGTLSSHYQAKFPPLDV